MFDRQKVFNFVATNLIAQGERSAFFKVYDDGVKHFSHCVYRGEGGKKCAFGFLIPDELYDVRMENKSCNAILLENEELKTRIFNEYGWPENKEEEGNDRWFLKELQMLHDEKESWDRGIRKTLVEFAADNNLKVEF